MGKAIKPGYNTHYVVTQKDGFCYKYNDYKGELYNEIVINQESQIVPAFIFAIDESKKDRPEPPPRGIRWL